jgi:hypothetical protein
MPEPNFPFEEPAQKRLEVSAAQAEFERDKAAALAELRATDAYYLVTMTKGGEAVARSHMFRKAGNVADMLTAFYRATAALLQQTVLEHLRKNAGT